MKKILFILMTIIIQVSCSTQHRLQKAYSGKPVEIVKKDFGNPETIIQNQDDSVYVYETEEQLAGTEISQGKLTLDPIVSPPVTKTERFYFTVNKGIVTQARYEEVYDR
jgi:hypothetical protein